MTSLIPPSVHVGFMLNYKTFFLIMSLIPPLCAHGFSDNDVLDPLSVRGCHAELETFSDNDVLDPPACTWVSC